MIGTAGRTAKDGIRGGLRGLREYGQALGKMGIPAPPAGRSRRRTGFGAAALLAAAAVGIAALVLYLRKRRQVAEHYTMGGDWEAQAAGIGGPEAAGLGGARAVPT